MTITPYQVDSVLNAYTRQSKLRLSAHTAVSANVADGKYTDVVSLSTKENKAEELDQISYNLRDVILKNNEF